MTSSQREKGVTLSWGKEAIQHDGRSVGRSEHVTAQQRAQEDLKGGGFN